MRAYVVGASGNLGSVIVSVLSKQGWTISTGSASSFIENQAAARDLLSFQPDVVINAAAYNDVDGAENEEQHHRAIDFNVHLPGVLATLANDANASIVHFSSDYVFDGSRVDGYAESDEPRPLSMYGRTKRMGETAVLAACRRAYVCRVSKIFGPAGASPFAKPSFAATMLKLAQTHATLDVVDEEVGSPSFTVDIAEAIPKLLSGAYPPGVYHLLNEGPGVTWYAFARELFEEAGVTIDVRPVPSSAFPKIAVRPKFAALRSTAFPLLRPRRQALKAFFDETRTLR